MGENRDHRLQSIFRDEEEEGEKFVYRLRWIIIVLAVLAISYSILRERYLLMSYYGLGIVGCAALYNLALAVVFRMEKYRGWIKYVSVLVDAGIVAGSNVIASYTILPLAPVTSAVNLLYPVVLVGSALRLGRLHALFTMGIVLLFSNGVYAFRYPLFSDHPMFDEVVSADLTGQFFKSLYIVILGFLTYHISDVLRRLVSRVDDALTLSREKERRFQKRYEEMINSIGDGIVVADLSSSIRFVNPALEMLSGFGRGELIGRELSSLVRAEDGGREFTGENAERPGQEGIEETPGDSFPPGGLFPEHPDGLFRERPGGEEESPRTFEARLRCRDGSDVPVEVSFALSRILDERMVLATVRDIRKRKTLERYLLQTQKMEAIGRLACGFAHDFNNLISIMSENVYLIQDDDDPGRIKECLESNLGVVEKSRELLDQILLFSQDGRFSPDLVKETSLRRILEKLERLIQNAIPRDIELVIRPENAERCFMVNEAAVTQVLLNLLLNAKEAIGSSVTAGRGRLEVDARISKGCHLSHAVLEPRWNGRDENDCILLSVRDNGTGIERAVMDHIFEPFFTTKVSGPVFGSGLGLSIVYSIIENIDGGVAVESTDRGTDFTVCIPVSLAGEESSPSHGRDGGDEGRSILIADDDEDVRLIGKKILEKHGFRVTVAGDGETLLSIVRGGNRFDALILDYHMPGMEGHVLLERVLESCDAPIVVSTGDVVTLDDGAIPFLPPGRTVKVLRKPIDAEFLLQTLDGFFEDKFF
jgi:signal transduction histidine kinase/CheY-like chemotaxis protein